MVEYIKQCIQRRYTVIFVCILNIIYVNGSPQRPNLNVVRVNKCCERFEIFMDGRCADAVEANTTVWEPIFSDESGLRTVKVSEFKYVIGRPACGTMQRWPIYHYPTSTDKLTLLPDGKLRHYIKNPEDTDDNDEFIQKRKSNEPMYYDHENGQYCMDKAIIPTERQAVQYAMVCSLEKIIHWTDPEFLLKKIVNPIFHGIAIIILLVVAIIYFVLPTLRDLVGNIVTTITMCLIVGQAADLIRIITETGNHISFLIADSILYVSILASFFWLNSMGYYIWKTFRSRNVFLRVTDGRKYCWYSFYVWGSTALMAGIAIFAHFYLDSPVSKQHKMFDDQETFGSLGHAVFFTSIAFIIIMNIFFYATTLKVMNRIYTYGRIHHKLKCNFIMFALMFLIMSVAWVFLILSWLDIDGLLYAHIFISPLQAPLLLYVCVIRQKHVTFLLKKSCCYNEPPATTDWGDELTYMNGGDY